MKADFVIMLLGILNIIYYVILRSTMGAVVFSSFFLIMGIIIIFIYIVDKKSRFSKKKGWKKPISVIKSGFVIFIILFAALEGAIYGFSLKTDGGSCDFNIVLGAGLRGEDMTLSLQERMEEALKYNKNTSNYIVLTGGKGPGESISEAEAMKRYLINNGINESRILIEDNARNTMENLNYSKFIIEDRSGKNIDSLNIKIITSNYHCLRSYILARRNGYENLSFMSSKTNVILVPVFYVREFFALVKSIIFDIKM